MDRLQKVALVENVVKMIREYDNQRKIAYDCFGFNSESKLGESMAWIVDSLVTATSIAIDDTGEFLSWFLWECNCGDSPKVCTVDDTEFTVDSVEEFVKVLCYFAESEKR